MERIWEGTERNEYEFTLGRRFAIRRIDTSRNPSYTFHTAKIGQRMNMSVLQRIRQLVIDRRYYLSAHAEEEMWADGLERPDVERCILRGRIEKRMTRDIRGTRYRIEGPARDERLIHVICRFHEVKDLLIITVYALEEKL